MVIIAKKKRFYGFYEYEKKINKEIYFVLLSQESKKMRPHFFKNKGTANKRAKEIKEKGRKAKVRPYRKSYVIYFR